MSRRIKIYLDTSVINFLFADDAPESKAYTIDFFDNFIKTKCIQERSDELSNRHLACLQAGRLLNSSPNRQNIFECT